MSQENNFSQPLPVIEDWMRFLGYLIDTTEKFPKKARFTFAGRITNLGLDIMEGLIEAKYTPKHQKSEILKRINLELEKLRILLRLAQDRKYLSLEAYEHCAREMQKAGQQIGGWQKKTQGKHETTGTNLSSDNELF